MPVEQWLEVDGLRLHGWAAGDAGPALVLLHGGGLDSATLSWGRALEPLGVRCRVYAFDWPGYGRSSRTGLAHTLDVYTPFLGRLLDALRLRSASLAGLSMGGAIALGFALSAPERVEKLILVDSYGLQRQAPGGSAAHWFVKLGFLTDWTYALLRRSPALVRRTLRGILHNPASLTPDLLAEAAAALSQPDAGRAFQAFQQSEITPAGLRTVYLDQLPALTTPTLLIHGAQDTLVPLSCAQEAARRLPHARLEIFEGCGHWLPRDAPERFNQAVLDFVAPAEAGR